jgi:hypothetical protein
MTDQAQARPTVAFTHLPWYQAHPRSGTRSFPKERPYATPLLHMSVREPSGFMVVDVYGDEGYRPDLDFITGVFGALAVRCDTYPVADDAEAQQVIERMRRLPPQDSGGDRQDMSSARPLNNHVVGVTRLPRLGPADAEVARRELAQHAADLSNVLLQLRFDAPWGWLLLEPALDESRWCAEHVFVRELYATFDVAIEAQLYNFIDRLHETAIDRLATQLGVELP